MSEIAVAEKPEAPAVVEETKPDEVDETKAVPDGTDANPESGQTSENTDEGSPPKSDDDDDYDQRYEAAVEEKVKVRLADEVAAELAKREKEQRAAKQKADGATVFQREIARLVSHLDSGIKDEYGEPIKVSPESRKAVTDSFEALSIGLSNAHNEALASMIDANLPAEAKAGFFEVANKQPTEDFVRLAFEAAIEHGALETKAVKTLSLERILELSPKAKADQEKALLKEYNRGRDKGRVGGEPKDAGAAAAPTDSGPKDLQEAELMLSRLHPEGKTMTTTEFRQWRRSHGIRS